MTLSTLIFHLIVLVTLASATIAFLFKDIIHTAMLLVVTWAGIAAFYLWAGAEFVALAQVLVYVGAILMIIFFAVVLTRRTPVSISTNTNTTTNTTNTTSTFATPTGRARIGIGIAAAVAAAIIVAILRTDLPQPPSAAPAPAVTMHTIGLELMGQYAGALLIIGALLTVALLGAVLLAAQDGESPKPIPHSEVRTPHSK